MPRRTGYLANALNAPPLVFRFQYNPELMQEKKSFEYKPAKNLGKWSLSKLKKQIEPGGIGAVLGFLPSFFDDVKAVGPTLVRTQPLEANEGSPRTFALDFKLDALDTASTDRRETIEPDLAILRSFMNPALELPEVLQAIGSTTFESVWKTPPPCDLIYGGVSVTCVMSDLNIKMTDFFDDGAPARADVSVSLKEQSESISTITDWALRYSGVFKSFGRDDFATDLGLTLPGAGAVVGLIRLFD